MKSIAAGWIIAGALLSAAAQAQDVSTVPAVNLDRYVGKWYEIARFPNKFEALCAGHVTAEYAKREDGRLSVKNSCAKADGSIQESDGVARIADPATNAKLEVRFAPRWLAWLPFVWADYWIIDLAPDYSTAAIGDPNRNYLWILSRTPELPEETYQDIVNRLTEQGYDTSQLKRTRQE